MNERILEKIIEVAKKNRGLGRMRLAQKAGCSDDLARRALKMIASGTKLKPKQESKDVNIGKTLNEFRDQYDIPLRIQRAIKKHLKGIYLIDREFQELCGVSGPRWRKAASSECFDNYRALIYGTIYWAQPDMLAKMKEIAGVL